MKKITVQKTDFLKLLNIACKDWKIKFIDKFGDALFTKDTLDFEESFLEEMERACNTSEQTTLFNKIFKEWKKDDVFSVDSISEVCKRLNITELKKKDFSIFGDLAEKMLAMWQIKQLEKFYNKGWIPDFNNGNQYKYFPYFEKRGSGWVVRGSGSRDSLYYGGVGLYKDQKTSDFIGRTYINIYIALL